MKIVLDGVQVPVQITQQNAQHCNVRLNGVYLYWLCCHHVFFMLFRKL